MTYEWISALGVFAFVASITPGPNNLMVMASGANFGFRRTISHMLGVNIGFVVMLVLIGIGLARVFDLIPFSQLALKVLSVGYMLFLALKIARSAPPKEVEKSATPITFLQAAAFQWVNPKAWAMALGAMSIYAPSQQISSILLVAVIFGLINLPAVSSWIVLGQQMRQWLNSPKRLRIFNYTMAALLVVSLYPVLI